MTRAARAELQAPHLIDLELHVAAPGPLPDTPMQERATLRGKIAYGHVNAPYKDGAMLSDEQDTAAARSALLSSSQAASSAREMVMGAQRPEALAASFMSTLESTLNTAGLSHMKAVVMGWSVLPRLREVYKLKKVVQDELRFRVKLEEAVLGLDKHLFTLVHSTTEGLITYEGSVFSTGSLPNLWEQTYKDRVKKFTDVLHDLRNSAKGETKLFEEMNVGFLIGKVTGAMMEAAANGDKAHCYKMAGVLATLNSWRAFVDHVLNRRMLTLLQAMRSKAKRISKLQHQSAEYKAAVEANLEEMAKVRDNMPPLPLLQRMVHMGYMADRDEPQDEIARIEARAPDIGAFIGELPEGFWARPASAVARALAAPAS